jgi:hypothetical protein
MDTDLRAQGGNGARVFVKSTMSSVIAEHVSEGLTFVYAHVLPEVIMTTEFLPTSLDRTLVRLLVGVDGSYMPLQMFATSKGLVASFNRAPIHPHILLHATLYNNHGRSRHPPRAGFLSEVRYGHGRSQVTRSRGAHTATAAGAHATGAS